MRKYSFLLALPFALASITFGQQNPLENIIEPGSKVEKLADGFSFTEGPIADSKGNVYFTDQPNNKILVWNSTNGVSVFMDAAGRANGMILDKKGNLWACCEEKNEVWIIAPNKSVTIIPSKYNGKLLNGPNDIWVNKNGSAYFTDPFWRRSFWDHTEMPQEIQAVYYIAPDHKTIKRVIEDFKVPNGIVGTPDGKKLFVADMGGRKTWSYTINKDGSLTDKQLFCEMGSDGMTMDSEGNIYLTGRGVTVFDKTGKQIGKIDVPEGSTTNVCFGDKDLKSLFITAGKGLYRIRVKVKGNPG